MAEDCPDIPSQQPNNDVYNPVSCLQQFRTDRYTEAEACSTHLLHKKVRSENMLVKENLTMKKENTT
jgi:hypothetical protein